MPLSIKGDIAGIAYDISGDLAVGDNGQPAFMGRAALSGIDRLPPSSSSDLCQAFVTPVPLDLRTTIDLSPAHASNT